MVRPEVVPSVPEVVPLVVRPEAVPSVLEAVPEAVLEDTLPEAVLEAVLEAVPEDRLLEAVPGDKPPEVLQAVHLEAAACLVEEPCLHLRPIYLGRLHPREQP